MSDTNEPRADTGGETGSETVRQAPSQAAPDAMRRLPWRAAPSGAESWSSILLPVALILGLALLLGLESSSRVETEAPGSPIGPWLELLVGYMAAAAEIAAAVVIGIAILRGIWEYLAQLERRTDRRDDGAGDIRIRLGRSLALGLEFTVASDILRTAVAPTRQDILNLGAIVLLRTLLNYFLEREIRAAEERRGRTDTD